MMRSDSFDRLKMPTTDRETEAMLLQSNYNQAQQLLAMMGTALENADHTLDELEVHEELVGSAIVRKCQEFADGIGHFATQLEGQSEEERQGLAQACLQDAAKQQQPKDLPQQQDNHQLSLPLSEGDWMEALRGATSLLRDVEAAFREVGRQDADEIADVALTLARLFLMSLQSMHATITPDDLVQAAKAASQPKSTVHIEELSSQEDDDDDSKTTSNKHTTRSAASTKKESLKRLRILWPPLGPAVASACDWGKEWATQKPLLAVALGLTLWPAAVTTAIVGGSLVVVDGCLQDAYQNVKHNPLLETAEQGAAQLYHATRLGWLCTQLVTKQTFKIVHRQVKKKGGIGKIAGDVGGLAVDRALHPVETVQMAWNGLGWCVGMVTDTVQQIIEYQKEERRAIVELQ